MSPRIQAALVNTALIVSIVFTSFYANAQVRVRGYFRSDGTYVRPHYRSSPDGNFYNNWSTKGNVNPYTGKEGTKVTPPNSSSGPVRVKGYFRSDGTYVEPHYRSQPDGDTSNNWSTNGNTKSYPIKLESDRVSPPDRDGAMPEFVDWDIIDPLEDVQSNVDTASIYQRPAIESDIDRWRAEDIERAAYWRSQGYDFDPNYMNATMMDYKVKDIERAAYWKSKGYDFDPSYMNATMMDYKVKDIERAAYWKSRGYNFDPSYMNATMMDYKVKDIERAAYWKSRGYDFDPTYMNATMMDFEVKQRQALAGSR